METTNQAFIKAYRQDPPQAVPASPAIAGTTPQSDVGGSETANSVAAGEERSAIYGPPPGREVALPATSPPRRSPVASEKRPLTTFISRPTAGATHDSADVEVLRPGTTIASFEWPPVCRALAQQCGRQLDKVADQLIREAQASRSLIGVTGLLPGHGASTIALCLTARLAGRGRRLILVDGNFRSPRLAAWLNAVPTTGWQDVLKHRGALGDAVIRAQDDRFDLLALDGQMPANAERLVGGLQAVVTAGVLRHSYDVAIFDLGAFLDASSQPWIFELVSQMGIDAVLAVTNPRPAAARDLEFLAAQTGRHGCKLLGTIENRVVSPRAA